MAYLLLIGTVVAVVVIVLLIGVAVTTIWCCCRKKRASVPNKYKSEKGAHAEENHYEVLSDVTSVSKTANSGYLYMNTVPSEYTGKKDDLYEELSVSNEKKKVLVTKTTVTTEMNVVELPEGASLEDGNPPPSYMQSAYLDVVPVRDGAKSSNSVVHDGFIL